MIDADDVPVYRTLYLPGGSSSVAVYPHPAVAPVTNDPYNVIEDLPTNVTDCAVVIFAKRKFTYTVPPK